MELFLIGPPGAGKGTQARMLAEEYNLRHLSPGELLREEIEQETEAGRKALPFVEEGELVPYEIVSDIMAEEMFHASKERGFVADGFPRTLEQYVRFKEELQKRGEQMDLVLHLDLDREQILERLTGRLTCSDCGKNYHKIFHPPEQEGVCDACGGDLHQREDDDPATIQRRIKEYQEKRTRLLSRLERDGVLERVDAEGTIEEVFERVCECVERNCGNQRT